MNVAYQKCWNICTLNYENNENIPYSYFLDILVIADSYTEDI